MEEVYCTIAEVNTYAASNGEMAWLNLASANLAGAINNLAGYTSGVDFIAVDGIVDAANPIAPGDTFTISTDSTSTVYTVKGTILSTNTTGLYFSPTLAESVADNDALTFNRTSASLTQTRCVVTATKEIVKYIGILDTDGGLFQSTDSNLNKAAILQSIYLSKVIQMRDSAERISAYAADEYSDRVVSIKGTAKHKIDDMAKFYIDKFIDIYYEEIAALKNIYGNRSGQYVGR